jgi:hypothetical protein
LKKYAPDYNLRHIVKGKGSYWKETEFLITRGRTADLTILGRKTEIEGVSAFKGVFQRTAQKPYFTRVASQDFYKSLTAIKRLGHAEYVSRVQKIKLKDIIKPSQLKIKLMQRFAPSEKQFLINLGGRRVGSFAPMRKIGRIIPIERYKAIPYTQLEQEQHLNILKRIRKKMDTKSPNIKTSIRAVDDNFLARNIKVVQEQQNMFSSSGAFKSSGLTYGEQYLTQISFPRSSKTYSPPSSTKSSSPSVKSVISSILSSKSSIKSYSSTSAPSSASLTSSPSYNYWSGASYTPSSRRDTSTTTITLPSLWKIQRIIKSKRKKKFKPTPDIYGLIPDFTARALGMKATEVGNVEDAMKEIRKIQSGIGIRKGARFKDSLPRQTKGMRFASGNFQEKQLLRGIMA